VKRKSVFVVNKLAYASGKRPALDCILCGIAAGDPRVAGLEVYQAQGWMVCVNLYPYNTGHLMLFPLRHVEHIDALTDEEVLASHQLQVMLTRSLTTLYQPAGFNIGYNLGAAGGASIAHLHQHVVPRFPNEAGILDVLSGTRIIVEDPHDTKRKLREALLAYPGGASAQEILKAKREAP
jgi:ATP adenylyltransferase